MSETPTTLRDALTEALPAMLEEKHWFLGRGYGAPTGEAVDALLAHPAMQAIAEKVALAEAVEGLAARLERDQYGSVKLEWDRHTNWQVQVFPAGWDDGVAPYRDEYYDGPTLLDALRAARGERS